MGQVEALKIIYKSVEEIRPYADNPRKNDDAVGQVAESIRAVGFRNPIIVDSDGVIIAGHTRLKAARSLGMKQVPVLVADDLTPEQVRLYRLADNKTAEAADWDDDKLQKELEELYAAGIDMSLFGFEPMQVEVGEVVDDDFEPEIPEEPRCKAGQLWALGRHRLMIGDATDPQAVEALLGGTPADACITDPPYNVDYDAKERAVMENLHRPNARIKENKNVGIKNDARTDEEFEDFLKRSFEMIRQGLKPGGTFHIFYASSTAQLVMKALAEVGLTTKQQLVWVKNHFILGFSDYKYIHEPIIYGWTDGAPHYFDHRNFTPTALETPDGLEKLTKSELVETIRKMREDQADIIRQAKPVKSDLHPTMKPVELIARLMADTTKKGERVLDLFGGSGTTIIAAEQLGRTAYLMELEPKYAAVILDRYEKFTGQAPELLTGGIETDTAANKA